MDDGASSDGAFDATYNKLETPDDVDTDGHPLDSDQEKQQVIMSRLRLGSSVNYQKILAISLAVLAVILLAVDVGLGVYYNKLTKGSLAMEVGMEVGEQKKLYSQAVQEKEEAQKQLAKEKSMHQLDKWELEHLIRRNKGFHSQIDKLYTEISELESHIPMIKDGCRHCFPGWTYWNGMCFFFAASESLPPRSWQDARQFCNKFEADLVIVDSREKQRKINEFIRQYDIPSRPLYLKGFWIGLRDTEMEGAWKWINGMRLSEGFWRPGEPNDLNNEDCAATYPQQNPFLAWNDVTCGYSLKWICEMTSRFSN